MDITDATEPASPDPSQPLTTPLRAHPSMPQAFRDTVAALDDVTSRPVTEHAELYDAVHRDLRSALDDVDHRG